MAGLMLPSTVTYVSSNSVFGDVENVYKIELSPFRSKLELPAKLLKADYSYRSNFEVVKLSDQIYLLENISGSGEDWSYNILFSEFADFILITESPVDNETSNRVIKKVSVLLPGKSIRYLVQSHHHNDHIGGVRRYISNGTKIITTPNNVDLFTKIAAAPFLFVPDEQAKKQNPPIFELVTDKKLVVKDEKLTAEIYDIGPTVHAIEMLVTYFPDQGILFQSDMINSGEWPLNNSLTKHLVKKIIELKLNVKIIVGLTGKLFKVRNLMIY